MGTLLSSFNCMQYILAESNYFETGKLLPWEI